MVDVVYILKQREDHSELRYSLRSLRHIPCEAVWIAGHMPSWVRNVEHIETEESGDHWARQRQAIYAAATHPGVADQFVLMNDDFFFLRPLSQIPVIEVGPIRWRHSGLEKGRTPMSALYRHFTSRGVADPLEYAEHAPMVMGKELMAETHRAVGHIAQYPVPTAYGNYARLEAERGEDVVIGPARPMWRPEHWYASVGEEVFYEAEAGARIRQLFIGASWYEPQLADDFCEL